MSKRFKVHPETPQRRLLTQAAACLRAGGVIVYPTDSSYALACCIGDKRAVDRIRAIRQLDQSHFMTIVCRDLSEVANYAKVDNSAFRLLKTHTPGVVMREVAVESGKSEQAFYKIIQRLRAVVLACVTKALATENA